MKDEWTVGRARYQRRGSREEIANRWAVKLARIGTRLEYLRNKRLAGERGQMRGEEGRCGRSLTCRDVRVTGWDGILIIFDRVSGDRSQSLINFYLKIGATAETFAVSLALVNSCFIKVLLYHHRRPLRLYHRHHRHYY